MAKLLLIWRVQSIEDVTLFLTLIVSPVRKLTKTQRLDFTARNVLDFTVANVWSIIIIFTRSMQFWAKKTSAYGLRLMWLNKRNVRSTGKKN